MSWSCRDVGVAAFSLIELHRKKDITPIMENQMEKPMEHGTETGFI